MMNMPPVMNTVSQEDEYGNDEKCCIGMTTPWSMMSFPGWAEKSRKITRLALRIVH